MRTPDGPIGSPYRPDCRAPEGGHCHCSVCHRTFRALGDFDRHRKGGHCLGPTSLGLTEVDRLWATPEGHAQREALSARLRNR